MIREAFGHDEGLARCRLAAALPRHGTDRPRAAAVCAVGGHCVLMSPVAFLKQPVRWLRAISATGATTSGAPNFAYELCVRRSASARPSARVWTCANWKVAYNGAEPVRAATLRALRRRVRRVRLRLRRLSTRATAWPRRRCSSPGSTVSAEPHPAHPGRRGPGAPAQVAPADAGRTLVSSGLVRLDREVAIVDPETGERAAADRVGEIWVGGAEHRPPATGAAPRRPSGPSRHARRRRRARSCAPAISASCTTASCTSPAAART